LYVYIFFVFLIFYQQQQEEIGCVILLNILNLL
jgi:hypothetical protein